MRVLHVIDAGPPLLREFGRPRTEETFDDRVLACREVISRSSAEFDHHVCLLGWAGAAARGRTLGLGVDYVIPSMLARARLSVGRIGMLVRNVRPDMVHWWDRRWTGGCFGRPGRAWRLEAVLGSTPMKLPLWLSRGGALVCGSAERSNAMAAGLQAFDVPPPAFASRAGKPDDMKVLLLGPGADARDFIFMCGLIWGAGMQISGLVPASGSGHERTRRVGRTFQYPVQITTSDRPRSELLSGSAAAVWMGPAKPGVASPAVSITSALAAGVPVAVPFSMEWTIPAALRPRLVARNSTPNELARVLMNILGDPSVRDAVGHSGPAPDGANHAFAGAALAAYDGQSVAARPMEPTIRSPAA
jgi:hypothetical protein